MNRVKTLAFTVVLGLTVAATLSVLGSKNAVRAQDPATEPAKKQGPGQMPDLVKGLKDTPGCLGVETARTQGGKNVIFAWFENKKAAMAWYRSPTHKFYMEMMGGSARPPMAQVEDDGKPILCIASITPSKEQKIEGAPYNIAQISIELYSVVPGGASVGGTFAPASLKIPNHFKYDEKAEAETSDTPKPATKDEAKPKS